MNDAPAADVSARGYAICTTQRSGSNYLCQLLASTGVLGRPLEFFNAPGRRAREFPDYPDDPVRQLAMILPHGSTPNGVYGLKIFAYQFDAVAATDWPARLPRLHWIHFTRIDLLGQAISLLKAKQTGQWRSSDAAVAAACYDGKQIGREMRSIASADARWRLFFARNGMTPLRLLYEDLVREPAASVRAVAETLRLCGEMRIDATRIDVRQQRDGESELWRERFLAEHAGLSPLDRLDPDGEEPT
jgi:LPS sulfotransferase NodH